MAVFSHLIELSPGTPQAVYTRPAKMNVFICDVSGSMGWTMRQLAIDTIERVMHLPQGDAILVGIFASPGWYRWIAARALTDTDEYTHVCDAIHREFVARNTTCFSEVIGDVPKALGPFLAQYPVVTLTFMSDGCPVVPDLRVEDAALDRAAQALRPLLTAGAVVAYGDYADRARLARLAQTLGCELVTAQGVEQVGHTFEKVSKGRARKKKQVVVPAGAECVFTLEKDGTVTAVGGRETQTVVDAPEEAAVYALNFSELGSVPETHGDVDGVHYAAALALMQTGNVDEAINVTSECLGDVAIVNALGNALTNAELGQVEETLKTCITDARVRYARGKQLGCAPKDDAFDLLGLLELLMADPECRFYPRHEGFQMKRIGRATQTKGIYPKFEARRDVAVPLSRLVGHASELNLSIGVTIPGTIQLPDYVEVARDQGGVDLVWRDEIGLPQVYDTKIFRNYALIANALPACTRLPVSVREATFNTLASCDVLVGGLSTQTGPTIYELDLTRIPTCNRQRGKEAADFNRLAALAVQSLTLGSAAKVLRAKRDELDSEREGDRLVTLTDDQYTFLERCGVRRDGSFAPPTVQEEPTDVLDVRVLECKVKNGSPVSMKDFALMVEGKKKLNYVGEQMKLVHDRITTAMPKTLTKARAWVRDELEGVERAKREVDRDMNARRFAVALTGTWRKHFSEDEAVIDVDGHPVTLTFRTIQKKI